MTAGGGGREFKYSSEIGVNFPLLCYNAEYKVTKQQETKHSLFTRKKPLEILYSNAGLLPGMKKTTIVFLLAASKNDATD